MFINIHLPSLHSCILTCTCELKIRVHDVKMMPHALLVSCVVSGNGKHNTQHIHGLHYLILCPWLTKLHLKMLTEPTVQHCIFITLATANLLCRNQYTAYNYKAFSVFLFILYHEIYVEKDKGYINSSAC